MRLTVEEHSEAIKRYRHVRPAPARAGRCSARCPPTSRTCTLAKNHRGPHVAHGRFRKVLAVWDEGVVSSPPAPRRPGVRARKTPIGLPTRSPVGFLEALKDLGSRAVASADEIAFFIFFVAFIWFAIDWILLTLG